VQDAQVEVGVVCEEATGGAGLVLALGDQIDVVPTGKEIELVPEGTTVA
jgi:hypothetical protein